MIDVFAYLRVSGRSQVHGDGFRRQFIAIRGYCAANGLRIVRIFKERGVCGATELENRPALSELFNALEENGVKTVVIEKLDRLARDLMVQETMIADMQKSRYTLVSTCEPDLCSHDPSRILMRQIFGAIAQYEKCMIVLKLRGARQRKKAKGERGEGRHAYGEKAGEEIAVRQIVLFKRTCPGCGAAEWRHGVCAACGARPATTRDIARQLNGAGIKTRYGKPWIGPTVARILARENRGAVRSS